MGRLEVVVGGQYGSEGKGAVAAYLGRDRAGLIAVRVAGSNAGHSALDASGRKWALRHIPVVAVSNLHCDLVIGAGSEIDLDVLEDEIEQLEEGGIPVRNRLYVDNEATVIEAEHKAREMGYHEQHGRSGLTASIGSTGKGVGAARADRAVRKARLWKETGMHGYDTTRLLQARLREDMDVLIEGTQGYGLGTHAGHYPQCTSSDCRAIDFLSMAGLSPWASYIDRMDVWIVLRTFPIRVAGNSGPLKGETSWETLSSMTGGHVQPERTTVTKKVRRVGRWDPDLAVDAIEANGGPGAVRVALTFFDYWYPDLAGAVDQDALNEKHWDQIESIGLSIGVEPELIGCGPGEIVDLRKGR